MFTWWLVAESLPDLASSSNALKSSLTHTSFHDWKAGSQYQVRHIFSWLIIDSDKSETKGRTCGFKYFSKEELRTLVQMVYKFKPAGRDQWDKMAVQLCARGREVNLGWKLGNGHTWRNVFEKPIPKQKRIGSTESLISSWMQCEWRRLLRRASLALVDESPGSYALESVNENEYWRGDLTFEGIIN